MWFVCNVKVVYLFCELANDGFVKMSERESKRMKERVNEYMIEKQRI